MWGFAPMNEIGLQFAFLNCFHQFLLLNLNANLMKLLKFSCFVWNDLIEIDYETIWFWHIL